MNKRKIEKALQKESKQMYANVFDKVLNKLNIDPSTFETPKKTPWWKSLKFVSCCSAGLATALIITLAVTFNVKTDTFSSYINLTLQANNTSTEKPSFAYSMSEKYSVNYFIAKNDGAKIIANGLESNSDTNGLDLCANIINEASKTGFIEREAKTDNPNIITITVDSSTIDYSKSVANKLYDSIKNYCKANYIYASVEIEDKASDNSSSINEERYEKINQISQLAEIFNYKNDPELDYIPYYLDSIEEWTNEFETLSNEDLDYSISKLSMINDALKSDKSKKRFKKELNRVYSKYIDGLKNLDKYLNKIKSEIDNSINKLQSSWNYDYIKEKGEISYANKPESKSFVEKWKDLLKSIQSTDDFDKNEDGYRYDYSPDGNRPFDKEFDYDYDYDWEFDYNKGPREPHRIYGGWTKENNIDTKDKDSYINKIQYLTDSYNKIIGEYSIFEKNYLETINRIIANVYYHSNDVKDDYYYIDYSKEYTDRNDKYGHRDDESWEEWKKDYDHNWWDKR